MEVVTQGVLLGILATAFMDIWAAVAKYWLRLPTADWALVGRWFGHLPRGTFTHSSIANAPSIRNELVLGWVGHYVIGVIYGLAYAFLVLGIFSAVPSLGSALGFGLATLFAPWLILQPAMGAGFFARRTPRPAVVRLVNISMHSVFGGSLYLAWLLIRRLV